MTAGLAVETLHEGDAVDVAVQEPPFESGELDQRRGDVRRADLILDPATRSNAGTSEDQRHVEDFTVEHAVLGPAVKLLPVLEPLAVVSRHGENGLVQQTGFTQAAEEAAQVAILIAQLGGVHAREVTEQPPRSAVVELRELVLRGQEDRIMRIPVVQPEEDRGIALRGGPGEPLESPRGGLVGAALIALDVPAGHVAVLVERHRRVERLELVEVVVETEVAGDRERAVDRSRRVAGLLEGRGEPRLVLAQPISTRRSQHAEAMPVLELPRQDRRMGRRREPGRGDRALEDDPFAGHAIDRGRITRRGAVAGEVIRTDRVQGDEDHMGVIGSGAS